jgi:hypothetical protein
MVFGRPSEYPSLGRGPETEESQGFCFRLTAVYWSSPGDLSMVQANYDDMLRRRLVYKDVGNAPGMETIRRLRAEGPIYTSLGQRPRNGDNKAIEG